MTDSRDPSVLGNQLLADAACARAVYGKGRHIPLSVVYDVQTGPAWTGVNGHADYGLSTPETLDSSNTKA